MERTVKHIVRLISTNRSRERAKRNRGRGQQKAISHKAERVILEQLGGAVRHFAACQAFPGLLLL